jgi:hypothetical protein
MTTRINPPVYLASTTIGCWRCGSEMPAVAIIAPNVPEAEGEPCILSNIRSLPGNLRTLIQKRFPFFRLTYSKTAEFGYYANTCPRCGMLSGDFFLHCEPGECFFPTSEEETQCLTVEDLPLDAPVDVEAFLGMGTANLILEHGKRRIAEQMDSGT